MGEPSAATEVEVAIRRHRLRVRTVAVSFAAAVRSAHRDFEVGGAERDALIETWRAWAISVLDECVREAQALVTAAALDDAQRKVLEDETERGFRMVRDA